MRRIHAWPSDSKKLCYDDPKEKLRSKAITLMLLVFGVALLLSGGVGMVRGASGLAEGYGVPPIVVGMTVVAFGTSAPELVVNVVGSLSGETALAFGNIMGSNLANLGLVLGTAAVITPISLRGKIIRRELPLLLLATAVLLIMTLDLPLRHLAPLLDRSDGLVMLMLFGIFVYMTVLDFLRQGEDPLIATLGHLPIVSHLEKKANWLLVILGIAGLTLGAKLTIDNGAALAYSLGVSPVVVGMLVVAIGTSLPELVTSVFSALKGDADLCVGNVIGSNIFNVMFVLPISALIRPLAVPAGGSVDIFSTLLLSAAIIPIFIVGRRVMNRTMGIIFLMVYAGYMLTRYLSG